MPKIPFNLIYNRSNGFNNVGKLTEEPALLNKGVFTPKAPILMKLCSYCGITILQ